MPIFGKVDQSAVKKMGSPKRETLLSIEGMDGATLENGSPVFVEESHWKVDGENRSAGIGRRLDAHPVDPRQEMQKFYRRRISVFDPPKKIESHPYAGMSELYGRTICISVSAVTA